MGVENNIPEGWVTLKLDELSERVCVGFVGTCHKDYTKKGIGVPMIRTTNLKDRGLDLRDVQYISEEFHLKQKKSQLKKGDILIARHGVNGLSCLYNSEDEANCLNVVIVRANQKITDYKWLISYINSPTFRHQVNAYSTGSVQKVVNTKALANFIILTPTLKEQKAIAKVLAAFDDKIELLQAQNKTLEAMAQTIFKEWFGKYQIGDELPVGWRVDSIDNLINIIIDYRGKTPKKLGMDWSNKGIEALSAKTIKNGKIVRRDAMNLGSKELYSIWMKDELQKGDILLTSEAPLGEMYYLPDDTKYILSQRLFALRVNESITSEYLYHYLFSKYGQHLLKARSSGSTVEGIRQSELRKVEVIIPEVNILNKASSIFKSIFIKTAVNENQIQYLNKTRDTLLPKLMSGQVRVKNLKQTADA